jgi:hypothetical protein
MGIGDGRTHFGIVSVPQPALFKVGKLRPQLPPCRGRFFASGNGSLEAQGTAQAVICPTGGLAIFLSSPLTKNFPLPLLVETGIERLTSRPRWRGVSRSSRTLGAGCDGRGSARRRTALTRTAKSCGPDASTLASSRRKQFPPATVTRKPDHRGEREGNR